MRVFLNMRRIYSMFWKLGCRLSTNLLWIFPNTSTNIVRPSKTSLWRGSSTFTPKTWYNFCKNCRRRSKPANKQLSKCARLSTSKVYMHPTSSAFKSTSKTHQFCWKSVNHINSATKQASWSWICWTLCMTSYSISLTNSTCRWVSTWITQRSSRRLRLLRVRSESSGEGW